MTDQSKNQSAFTPAEIAYMQSQRLGRLATVGANGQPHVVPVNFRYNPETDTIDIGGHLGFAKRKKWRDAQHNPRVAIVIDDLVTEPTRTVRGIEIRGEVELLSTGGQTIVPTFDSEMFRLHPTRIASWGIDTGPYAPANARSITTNP